MTIAAGFRFKEGIVVCADTQETTAHAKKSVPKLEVRCSGKGYGRETSDDLAIAIAGAGYGPMIDKLVERIWSQSCGAKEFDEACSAVEESIKETYREYGSIYQPGAMPEVELIYGIKISGRSGLFVASGPFINERDTFGSIGSGYYMADFLASRLHGNSLTKRQAIILAAYVLFQCKEYVDGCGGDSQIAFLNEGGCSNHVDSTEVKEATDDATYIDAYSPELVLMGPDISVSKEYVDNFVEMIGETIHAIREIREEAMEQRERMRKRMLLLLEVHSKRLAAQKSESEQ